jgi:hypothetical protein
VPSDYPVYHPPEQEKLIMTVKPTGLPRQLARMSPEQVESVLAYLGSLPLAKLRARQALDNALIERVWASPAGEVRDTALANLQIDQELIAEAIGRGQFPDWERRTIEVSRWL